MHRAVTDITGGTGLALGELFIEQRPPRIAVAELLDANLHDCSSGSHLQQHPALSGGFLNNPVRGIFASCQQAQDAFAPVFKQRFNAGHLPLILVPVPQASYDERCERLRRRGQAERAFVRVPIQPRQSKARELPPVRQFSEIRGRIFLVGRLNQLTHRPSVLVVFKGTDGINQWPRI